MNGGPWPHRLTIIGDDEVPAILTPGEARYRFRGKPIEDLTREEAVEALQQTLDTVRKLLGELGRGQP